MLIKLQIEIVFLLGLQEKKILLEIELEVICYILIFKYLVVF